MYSTQVMCLCLVGAENVKAECKNNDGEIVPCQTSEEHIKHLTRALTRGGAGSEIDQRLAPNSYSAEVLRLGGWYNDYLRTYTKTFNSLNSFVCGMYGAVGGRKCLMNTRP